MLAMVMELPGVIDCSDLKINGKTENVPLLVNQVPLLGDVTVTEV